ncbi:radical SAM protein [Candidatus Woesearchaeota archaeon]|nr:radical SAM protein [Candidatus Woesearchaeota archaeon]
MVKLVKQKKVKSGRLAKGCKLCIKGRKSVLFITSACHYECFYCPISDDKRKKDVVKINEKELLHPDSSESLREVFDEIRLCQSKGVGITGGDPLAKTSRTYKYIKALKKEFGKSFHIHVYTSLPFVTKEKLLHLESAGLDEIRFHFNNDDVASWKKILFVKELKMKWGVEVPAIPGKLDTSKKIIDFCKANKADFINLNELEYSDISNSELKKQGFKVKDSLSYGIQDSEAVAHELVLYGKKMRVPVHYCSSSFKDAVQLGNRFLLRAQKVAKPFDAVDYQGMLTRGEITLKRKDKLTLDDVRSFLIDEMELPSEDVCLEDNRLLVAADVLESLWPMLLDDQDVRWGRYLCAAIVVEYPTDDHFLVQKVDL